MSYQGGGGEWQGEPPWGSQGRGHQAAWPAPFCLAPPTPAWRPHPAGPDVRTWSRLPLQLLNLLWHAVWIVLLKFYIRHNT